MPRAKPRRTFDETPPELRWPLGPLGTGLLLFAWAAVVALALSFPDGALSGWLRGLLRGALGQAAYLTPPLLVGLGLAAWRPPLVPGRRLERHAIVSWLVLLTALAGLLQPLAGRPPPAWDGDGGGLLGWLAHAALERSLGPASAAVVLGSAALVAACVALGLGPRHFARGLRIALRWLATRLRRLAGPSPTVN
ncbi:MAG TPA: DNA translocase FtsK 4TM domain-containing protein, partial [Chloroflexota bacterium]